MSEVPNEQTPEPEQEWEHPQEPTGATETPSQGTLEAQSAQQGVDYTKAYTASDKDTSIARAVAFKGAVALAENGALMSTFPWPAKLPALQVETRAAGRQFRLADESPSARRSKCPFSDPGWRAARSAACGHRASRVEMLVT